MQKIAAPGWARTTNLSVNSRTRYPIAPRRVLKREGFTFAVVHETAEDI